MAAKKKAAPKKKATRRRKPPVGKGGKTRTIDREVYARARAEGATKCDAAKLAGSKAKSQTALSTQGAKLEAEAGMAELMAIERERVIRSMDDTWEKAQARMAQMLDHPKWQARKSAADFSAKVVGGYAAQKVEHSGSVEATPAGEFASLSADEREALRAILAKRAEG